MTGYGPYQRQISMKGICWQYSPWLVASAIHSCIAHHEVETESSGYVPEVFWRCFMNVSDEFLMGLIGGDLKISIYHNTR